MYFTLNNCNLTQDDHFCFKPVPFSWVALDTKLNWDPHVENVCKTMTRVFLLLRQLKQCVIIDVLITT